MTTISVCVHQHVRGGGREWHWFMEEGLRLDASNYGAQDGKTFKSAKDVEKHLRDSRQFSQVTVSVPETDEEPGTRKNKEPRKADEDPDFQPPAAKSAKTACGKGFYEIECSGRAADAEKVIDPGLGKGHSNLPEATFSVLTKFRAKDVNLHQKHYAASTNLGLIQANMTWCYEKKGPEYHWIEDLSSTLGLPLLDGIQEMCKNDNEDRMKRLERKRTEEGKKKRVQSKINRTEEQTLRKKYIKNCQIRHIWGG
ncbi:uncharacterized protein [Porites lutea]|uniref:uncharacterized protein n=1 Tax=Porites lutea TaxID=51062 RepID=UPI003CC5EB90